MGVLWKTRRYWCRVVPVRAPRCVFCSTAARARFGAHPMWWYALCAVIRVWSSNRSRCHCTDRSASGSKQAEEQRCLLFKSGASANAMCGRGGIDMGPWPWPACISTGCPLEMPGEEADDAETSLCPCEDLDKDTCRGSTGVWWFTDSNLQSLLRCSHCLHFCWFGEPI